MLIEENKDLSPLSAIGIGGNALYYSEIENTEDIVEIVNFSKEKNLPLTIVGGGTNTIFNEGTLNRVIGLMRIEGIELISEDTIKVGAGEDWDKVVAWTVDNNLSGIEALSAIPGTMGAGPVQNIGAYGAEISDTFVSAEVYDLDKNELITLDKNQCGFSYRDSIFKQNPGRYIIATVTLQLSKEKPTVPEYKDVQKYFEDNDSPTLGEIRDAIISIRSNKLPDPKIVPNLGSYFKNPIVSKEEFERLQDPNIPNFEVPNGIKLFAGWLIEQCGFKGQTIDGIKVYEKNALVLTNPEKVKFENLQRAESEIIEKVQEKFGITLEREPNIIE